MDHRMVLFVSFWGTSLLSSILCCCLWPPNLSSRELLYILIYGTSEVDIVVLFTVYRKNERQRSIWNKDAYFLSPFYLLEYHQVYCSGVYLLCVSHTSRVALRGLVLGWICQHYQRPWYFLGHCEKWCFHFHPWQFILYLNQHSLPSDLGCPPILSN